MFHHNRLRELNALTLQWHAGVSTIVLEAFQAWALALLKPEIRFDGAIWGVLSNVDGTGSRRINSAHLHRLATGASDRLEQLLLDDFSGNPSPARALAICLADPAWAQPGHAALVEHGRRYDMTNSLSIRFADFDLAGKQFVMLTRQAASDRFSPDEIGTFEFVAPHMMQAYTTCQQLFIGSPQSRDLRSDGWVMAMMDHAGVLHDEHADFAPMLRREWSDWPGERLPEPLLELAARRAGTHWRFVGEQVSADFEPVGDLHLVTVRPRLAIDVLTPREGEIAQRYAAGANFREIAESLELAPATVRSHLRNVFGKLKIRNKSQLAAVLRQR